MAKNMYEYFANTWSERKKSFKYTEKQRKKLGLGYPDSAADRFVSPQPAIFRQSDGSVDLTSVRYNQRKVSELPNAFKVYMSAREFGLKRHYDMKKYVNDLLFSYEFLLAWNACSNWSTIEAFIGTILDNYTRDDKALKSELELLRQTFLLCCTIVYNNPLSLAPQLAGRLQPYCDGTTYIPRLLDDIQRSASSTCSLFAPHFNLEAPGGALVYILNNHQTPINCCM